MKYKVGDRVRIKSIKWYNENKDKYGYIFSHGIYFVPRMSLFCGCVMTINAIDTAADNNIYYVEENACVWTEDMFEGLAYYNENMKNIENIEITLNDKNYIVDVEKAKELGVLKEKDTICKTWKEFKLKYKNIRGYSIDSLTDEIYNPLNPISVCEQLTKNEAIAIKAFSKLLKLRRDWIGDWNPDWCNCSEEKFCIEVYKKGFYVNSSNNYSKTFSFPTKEMAKKFLECFVNLFEQCKNLI